jgi:phytanoyl-CoA hydroxylase
MYKRFKYYNFYIMKKLFSCFNKNFSTGGNRVFKDFFNDRQIQFYKDNGYVVLPNVFSKDYIEELKAEVSDIVSKADEKELSTRFHTGVKQNNSEDYFMESGDKIRYFLENNAYDEQGKLIHPLKDSINKIGHCLHDLNKKFIDFSYSPQIQHMARKLGYVKPIVPQSMYIFKNAKVGGEVPPHTDNTFIRTKPSSCFVNLFLTLLGYLGCL